MLRRALLSLALVAGMSSAAVTGAQAAASPPRSVSAASGGLTATLSYRGAVPSFRDLRLTIARGATTLYRAPVSYRACGRRCWPVSGSTATSPVQITDVQNDGAADVLLNLYSGGAHCCSIAEVFSPRAAPGGRYVLAAAHDFGDPGYRLRTLGGRESFVTGDDSFAYAFTDYAASGLPLQILRLTDGRFADVTSQFPALVRRDATRWLTAYVRARGRDDVGVAAAWAADECRLGRSAPAFAYLRAQARAGRLQSGFGRAYSGTRFIARLRTQLRRDGYLR